MKSKVLVADDSPTIQKVIDITLANEPCELDQALSVEQLFEQLDANHYNLVLLDFCLSEEMNGFDLAQKIFQESPGSLVVMMFGTFDSYEQSELDDIGIFDKIVKPFDGKKFIKLCRQAFKQGAVEVEVKQEPEQVQVQEEEKEVIIDPERLEEDILEQIAGISDEHESVGSDWCVDIPSIERDEDVDSLSDRSKESVEDSSEQVQENEQEQLQDEMHEWGFGVPSVIGCDNKDELEGAVPAVIEESESATEAVNGEQLWQVDHGEEEIPPIEVATSQVADPVELTNEMREDIEQRVASLVEEVVRKYCSETVERVAWEIIPDLAENLIKKELKSISDSIK
ncbi:MAG: response regulator [Bdellovibrionales bacterium]|jgi:CheY-like chemotaxis protein|nr:response regulator [Bdellovibrionales bacterium]MBT3525690.1 response regulator [Bdellovibrionales bacterium]MBT7669739.1 response regulator [Bdellovibrionales bacterium]MBT7767680.1 response regulator [Bdellovibrionales bacterium]